MNSLFQQDLPRLKLYLNNDATPLDTRNPHKIWCKLNGFFDGNGDHMKKISYYCTQACMGDIFVDEFSTLDDGENILSAPTHIVNLVIKNVDTWTIDVTRYFRLAYITECGDSWDLDMIKFNVKYDSKTKEETTCVDYALDGLKMDKSMILEEDLNEKLN